MADTNSLFWTPAALSIIHDSKFFDLVAEGEKVHAHRSTISSFDSHTVTLANNAILQSDTVVFATGWTTTHSSIFPPSLLPNLGFPIPLDQQSPELEKHWNELSESSMNELKKKKLPMCVLERGLSVIYL